MSTAAGFGPWAVATRRPSQMAMQRLWLTGKVLPAGARLVVQHVFRSGEEQPLEVVYAFPLPRDAALRSFRITGDGFEAHSELKPTEAAVKSYEEGIAAGSLSSLARQYGDGLVNLSVGNIRPNETVTVTLEILCGVELRDDGLRFRFPFTLAPAYHSLAKTAVISRGVGEMELPADRFGDVLLPGFCEDASALHQIGFELSVVGPLAMDEIGSPSHTVKVRRDGGEGVRVALAAEKEIPDRDLVLDAHYASVTPQVLAGLGCDGKGHFAAIMPSTAFGAAGDTPRRVVILLDRSGSMDGAPILQARKAIEACLGTLAETDLFGLVAFDSVAALFRRALVPASRGMRDEARLFLESMKPRGGTELAIGFREAAKLLEGGDGDILTLTDGQVSGTEEILASARAAGVRLHCLGIGSASQDRFLALLARETGGVSRFVTPRERVDLPAVDLFASIGRPAATQLKAGGNIQPEPPRFVFKGTPVLLFGEVDEARQNQIELSWNGGQLKMPVAMGERDIGETVRLLQGSRLITDWESRYPSSEALAPLGKRKEGRVSSRLLALSESYGLASREMSLVAVVKRTGDRPGELPETRVVPVGMPQDTAFSAYFAGGAATGVFEPFLDSCFPVNQPRAVLDSLIPKPPLATLKGAVKPGMLRKIIVGAQKAVTRSKASEPGQVDEEILLDLASRMEPDGGMPGEDTVSRAGASVIAMLAFLSQGHTPARGAFRSHVARLVSFLKSLNGLSEECQGIVAAVLEFARKGTAPSGDWIKLARIPGAHWKEIELGVFR